MTARAEWPRDLPSLPGPGELNTALPSLPPIWPLELFRQMRNPSHIPAVIVQVNCSRICSRLVLALALSLLPISGHATTVIAPDFDTLVSQADYVVRAVVKSKAAEWRSDAHGRHIMTKVTLDVKEIIKGAPPSPLVLVMLGGRI